MDYSRRAILALLAGGTLSMALKPDNPLVGGVSLARAQIQSPNFVTGVSGWVIRQDGSAEFNTGTFRGNIIGGALYIYDPSAAAGNLIASATDALLDPFGDVTLKGVTAYVVISGKRYAVNLNEQIALGMPGLGVSDTASPAFSASGLYAASNGTALAEVVVWSGQATNVDVAAYLQIESQVLSTVTNGSVAVHAGNISLGSGLSLVVNDNNGNVTATSGTAAHPTLITTDTWQTMSLINGWTLGASGYAQYKLEPSNRVSVRGANIIPGTVTGGTSIWTPPAAYAPSTTQRIGMIVEVSTGAVGVDTPRFDAAAGGFQVFNIPGSTTRVGFNGSYALD